MTAEPAPFTIPPLGIGAVAQGYDAALAEWIAATERVIRALDDAGRAIRAAASGEDR